MRFLFLCLLITTSASALNQTSLGMQPDREYMNFILTKYLKWHRAKFEFRKENPRISELVGHLDHWLVPGTPLRQITISHSVKSGKPRSELRLFIQPTLRKKFTVPGSADGSEPWFAEWDNDGSFCVLTRETDQKFTAWCGKENEKNLRRSWTEEIVKELPTNWPAPMPYQLREYPLRSENGRPILAAFYEVVPHPSRIPRELYHPLFLHTKEAQFSLDRISTSSDGEMKLHYP